MMAGQILVALKRHDRLSRMVPYIEEIAKPGMKIVLLIPCGREAAFNASHYTPSMANSLDESWSVQQLEDEMGTTFNITGAQLLEEQILRAEHKAFLALERLLKKGIDITVDVYTGSVRSAVTSYTLKGNVHLVMKRAGRALMMMQFFCRAVPNFVLLKPPSFSSTRMLRPNLVRVDVHRPVKPQAKGRSSALRTLAKKWEELWQDKYWFHSDHMTESKRSCPTLLKSEKPG